MGSLYDTRLLKTVLKGVPGRVVRVFGLESLAPYRCGFRIPPGSHWIVSCE